MPKVSVIIPLYNKAPYLKKALDSIASQTYTDWECIIINDGSTDDSATVASQWINASRLLPSAFCLVSQENAGVSAARNHGIALSQGEYIAFLDADDWWAPTFLERMLWLTEQYPEAGIYGCNYWYVKTGKTHVTISSDSIADSGYVNYPKMYLDCGAMPLTSISVLIPKRIFDEGLKFPVGVKLGEDFLTWTKIALCHKVAFLNEPLSYYNNNIPISARATRNLHEPSANMLFNMQHLVDIEARDLDWKALCDWLRVNGLLAYWLNSHYHDMAAEELQKVDWTRQSRSIRRKYTLPIWMVKGEQRLMQIGSWCKQRIIRLIHR